MEIVSFVQSHKVKRVFPPWFPPLRKRKADEDYGSKEQRAMAVHKLAENRKDLAGSIGLLKVPSATICFACLNLVKGGETELNPRPSKTNRGLWRLRMRSIVRDDLKHGQMWVRARYVQNRLGSIANSVFSSLCALSSLKSDCLIGVLLIPTGKFLLT